MSNDSIANPIRYNQHPLRKNNDLVAAMYAMYLMGPDGKPCSLAGVARFYRKARQTIYDVFRSRGYQLRTKELKGLQILNGIKFTLTKGGYLRGTTPFGRMMMQRYVWLKHKGNLPAGYVIYHKDGNKINNKIKNLKLVALSDISKTFNPTGRNQFSK